MTNLSYGRLLDSVGELPSAMRRKLAFAADDAQRALATGGAAGADLVQALADGASRTLRRGDRYTRDTLARWPLESVAAAAVAGIALGWVLRRLYETRRDRVARAEARSAARSSTASPRRRTRAAKSA
ncbi:MAG TPA: hypothetical protein VGC30_10695 [Dokdonella sp.]